MTLFQLYLLTRMSHLHDFFQAINFAFILIGGILVAMGIVVFIVSQDLDDDEGPKMRGMVWEKIKASFWVAIIAGFLSTATPTNNDLYVMMGGYYATNNAEIKKLPDNIVGAVNKFLEEVKPKEVVKQIKERN